MNYNWCKLLLKFLSAVTYQPLYLSFSICKYSAYCVCVCVCVHLCVLGSLTSSSPQQHPSGSKSYFSLIVTKLKLRGKKSVELYFNRQSLAGCGSLIWPYSKHPLFCKKSIAYGFHVKRKYLIFLLTNPHPLNGFTVQHKTISYLC